MEKGKEGISSRAAVLKSWSNLQELFKKRSLKKSNTRRKKSSKFVTEKITTSTKISSGLSLTKVLRRRRKIEPCRVGGVAGVLEKSCNKVFISGMVAAAAS